MTCAQAATPAAIAAATAEIDVICVDIRNLRRAEIEHEAAGRELTHDMVERRKSLLQRLDAAEAVARQASASATAEPAELVPTQRQDAWPRE